MGACVLTPGQAYSGDKELTLDAEEPIYCLRVLKSVALITKGYAGERDDLTR